MKVNSNKERYSEEELQEFKELIIKKLSQAKEDLQLMRETLSNKDNNGTDETVSNFKFMDESFGSMTKEKIAQLSLRQEKFINHLEKALIRIENKTYGICRITGKLIQKERLRAVPHATLSREAKDKDHIS